MVKRNRGSTMGREVLTYRPQLLINDSFGPKRTFVVTAANGGYEPKADPSALT